MNHYDLASISKDDFSDIVTFTGNRLGISEALIEKVFWVSSLLKYLFEDSLWRSNLLFNGGTCLSKCYDAIQRFSEDVDLLLDRVFGQVGSHDVNLFVDRSTFVSLEDLRSMATETSKRHCSILKRCEKATSHQNKCVQIADYVVGSFYANLQHGDGRFRELIKNKIILCP